ncbi:polysaccharide pyruvyl transferase family protein [Chroococcidiopsis sp. CCNUC1]|uniref:polysaccharide pyruvyl transferase family protein n=1 Tax=Chroococcidiopsis sp. CCNUC1 TaxID=2653189 RepID=UPI00202208D8|nr:polysaccharide pyruvyl transferase family protein [Chroococcidiopsis sp. CCNUC1]URD52533.1 polysaccharide pyruvyl transferase family protein [Chroococcidiopsis sp. CCNUC1]
MKALVAGWFSFERCNTTAGDLMARNLACEWLEYAGYTYDVALAAPFVGGVDWRSVDPNTYSHVVFVCGPFPLKTYATGFLHHFNNCHLIGLNLSMIEPLNIWNPFDVLIERDSSVAARPDITFISRQAKVPVVGIILVHPQPEYGDKGKHQAANDAVNRLIASQEMVAVPIDTGLDPNTTNLRTAAEIESIIARMDVVVTTRLHGTVLALKNGVPSISIDPISGGAKILLQTEKIGWPIAFPIDSLSDEMLQQAFKYCLSEAARTQARECRDRAIKLVEQVRNEFVLALDLSNSSSVRVLSDEVFNRYKYFSSKWSQRWEQAILIRYKISDSIKCLFK